MDTKIGLLAVRKRSRMSLRELAARAGTSHSTLLDYEKGRKAPSVDTFARIVHAGGFHVEGTLVTDPGIDDRERSEELEDVLSLAEQFPARHSRRLNCPVFGRR